MAIDTTSPRSRRALLTAALGGAAAAVAATVAKVSPVQAGSGNPILTGHSNSSAGTTSINNKPGGGAAFQAISNATCLSGFTFDGTAFFADASGPQGIALRVRHGRIKVQDASGVAIIKKGRKSVTVTMPTSVDINVQTFVLLTPMVNMGSRALWFTKSPSKNKFTIRMSSTRGAPTKVAWLAVERG